MKKIIFYYINLIKMVIKITFFMIFLVINTVNLSNISNKTYKEIELEDYVSNIYNRVLYKFPSYLTYV